MSAAHFVMMVKDIFVLDSLNSDKMPPETQTRGILVLQMVVRHANCVVGKKKHEFCRESEGDLNKLYIDGTPDISDGKILWPTGFWEVTFIVTAYL